MGTVEGAGEYVSGASVVLTAKPADGWTFKWFVINGQQTDKNPYSFTAGEDDVIVECSFYVSMENYLRGSVDFDIPERALNVIRIDRGVVAGSDVKEMEQKTLDLCYADMLMWITTTASTVQGAKESDSGWSHQGESKTLSINDKKRLEDRAFSIYQKYNDGKWVNTKKIRITNLW